MIPPLVVAVAFTPSAMGVWAVKTDDEDSFEKMCTFATQHALPFPYLHDESQDVARAYGAVCTPDFFGFNEHLKLQYRGRLDEGRTEPPSPGTKRDLFEAMKLIAETGKGPRRQFPSVGCSIKWRTARAV